MSLSRREFLQFLALAGAGGLNIGACNRSPRTARPADLYELPPFGDVTLLHFTDCHAQLLPIYFREPAVNIGIGAAAGKLPHLVGEALLKHFDMAPGTAEAHALTFLNFEVLARRYGKVGGFAHLASLIKSVRAQRPARTLLLTAATPGRDRRLRYGPRGRTWPTRRNCSAWT